MRYSKNILAGLAALFLLLPAPAFAAAAPDPQARKLKPPPSAITVSVPETVGDGTAFPCTFKAPGLGTVTVSFLKTSITAAADANGEAVVLLPVPLNHDAGVAPLSWQAASAPASGTIMSSSGTRTVAIRKRIYPAQRLTLAPKYVTPDPALQERIERERALLNAALTTQSPVRHWRLPMQRPVQGKITSWYGLRRILNGHPRNAHKGLDFRGAEGTPIACVADGTVVLTGDFYYPGSFAVVDHGLGVTSIYMHMSEIVAVQGQTIAAGDTVGLIGSTGRSTGPHLHLGITVLGQSIDAFPLLAMTAEDKDAYAKAFSDAAKKETRPEGKNAAKKKKSAPKKKTGAQNATKATGTNAVEKSAAGSAGKTR